MMMRSITLFCIRFLFLHLLVDENILSAASDVVPPPSSDSSSGIMWEDLVAVTQDSKQVILNPSSGYIPNGHVCGILGPSGAGKSTLLSAIAGRPVASLQVDGHILHYSNEMEEDGNSINCAPVVPERVAWLQQHDAFFERLSVKETLDLAVFLEWPQLSFEQREETSNRCLESLGLSQVKNRQVGSPSKARTSDGATLSGGELRRLSVALELVTNPQVFLADEPTSGIDAKMSETVMATILSHVKERQIPCICTLHQPRSSIWHMLNSFILMAPGGRICYVGSKEASFPYFASLGFSCPNETNPAEYFIDLVSVDTEDPNKSAKDRDRIDFLVAAFQKRNQKASKSLKAVRVAAPMKSMQKRIAFPESRPTVVIRVLRRFGALFRRSWRQTIRSRGLNIFRLAVSVGTALLLSQIFPSVAKGPPTNKSVADRICVLSFGAINMFMVAIMKTIGVFSKEMPVVHRERSHKDYTSLEYILSKSFAETPLDILFAVAFATVLKCVTGLAIEWKLLSAIFSTMTVSGASLGFLLGSAQKSEEAAIAAAMPVVIVFMIVGVINPSGVDPLAPSPVLIKFMKYFSPIASAIEALAVGEFRGMQFATTSMFSIQKLRDLPRMGGLALVRNGEETLDALGLTGVKVDGVLSHMVALSLINFGLCWLGLSISEIRVERWKSKARSFLGRRKRGYVSKRQRNASFSNQPVPKEPQHPTTRSYFRGLNYNGGPH